jgi:hypothetical protein
LGGGETFAGFSRSDVVLELYELAAEIVGNEGWGLMGGKAEAIPGVLFDPVVDGADTDTDRIGYLLLGVGLVDVEVKGLFLLVC